MIEGEDLELFERSVQHAVEAGDAGAVDAALDELGWSDALADDRRTAVSVLFERQGATGATSSALDRVLLDALGVESGAGVGAGGVVLPALGEVSRPGVVVGGSLTVRGLGTAGLAGREDVVVIASRAADADGAAAHGASADGAVDDGAVAVVVPTAATTLRMLEGIDPRLGLVEVSGSGLALDPPSPAPIADWGAVVAPAQVALGHELVGASRRMLSMAREHALERIQFGVPIAQFQAVRHRLAETIVAIETADAILEAAWLDGTPVTAAMAKASAGRAARTAARHCQQVLAGIGFTTEHDLHLFIRRVLVLDQLFGSARALTRALGDELLASRRLPPLLPL